MKLVFPFKNIATNSLLSFTVDKENFSDFIKIQQDGYHYSENHFRSRVEHFKDSLPNFENEILQIINTTNLTTIDAYFNELIENVEFLKYEINLENISSTVKKWNYETLKKFEETIEVETEEFFKSENRLKKHLEIYEDWAYGGLIGLNFANGPKRINRTNYNFYCIEKFPELLDENYLENYYEFLIELAIEYREIANRYYIYYRKGEIISKVEKTIFNKPVVFVEGDLDIKYLIKAAELLGQTELLSKIELRQRGGYKNLDKLWEIFKDNNWETIPQKKLLLYDCDTKKPNEEIGNNVFKRTIKTMPNRHITNGIENLFPNSFIKIAMQVKTAFIDIKRENNRIRGDQVKNKSYSINKDEKTNLCDWICKNGTANDFVNFNSVFEFIRLVL